MRIIAGKFRGKQLTSPSDLSIRPTADRVREAIFNIVASRLSPSFEGLRVLDLFAGTGAMGIEALSRGAAHVIFVDTAAEARGLIRDHIQEFGIAGISKLLRRDAVALGDAGSIKPFDLVFLDPPYGQALGEAALASLVSGNWIAPGALLILEDSVDAEVVLPDGFVLADRRVYGSAAVHVLEYGAE